MLPLNLFELIILTILSKLRFSFYPFVTFPDPLEYYTYKSALDKRAEELNHRHEELCRLQVSLANHQNSLTKLRSSLDRRSDMLTTNETRMMQMWQTDEEVKLVDSYGRNIYATPRHF